MRLGDVMFTNKFEHRGGFDRKAPKATFKAKDANTLLGYIYIGGITVDSAPHFSADGALAALGYGPIMTSVTQRGVIEALKSAREFAASLEDFGDEELAKLDKALAAAANFTNASAPVVDPIMKDAARFNALINLLCAPGDLPTMLDRQAGIEATLWRALGAVAVDIDADLPMRERLVAIIDAATQK